MERAGLWALLSAASATRPPSAIPITTPWKPACTTPAAALQLFVSYTYSKSIDQASNLGDQVDPFDPNLSRGLSSFDMRQNFVASYTYRLPFERLFRADNRWTEGWSISGITRFSTGFPVTFYNYEDTSLLGTQGNGINNLAVDELEYTPGPLDLNHNPRNGNPYFNTSLFSLPPLGSVREQRPPVLLRAGNRQLRFDVAEELQAHRIEIPGIAPGGIQRLQPRAVLRPAFRGWQHQQRDLRPGRQRRPSPTAPDRAKDGFLTGRIQTQLQWFADFC